MEGPLKDSEAFFSLTQLVAPVPFTSVTLSFSIPEAEY